MEFHYQGKGSINAFPVQNLAKNRIEAQPPNLGNSTFSGKNLPFVGFSFNRDSKLSDIGMRNLDNSNTSSVKSERKISKNSSETPEKILFLEEKIKKSEQKISMLENQRFSEKKETEDAIKSLEDQLAIKIGELLDKDHKIASMIETLHDFESKLDEEESQRYARCG